MDVLKTSDYIHFKIQIPNPSQESPVFSKAPKQELKDMDVLCNFKLKMGSQNSRYWGTKDQWPYPNQYQDAKPKSGTFSPHQSPKSGLKGHGCSLLIQNQDREKECINNYWPYTNQNRDPKPQSGTSNILQSPHSGLKGHRCSLHLWIKI